MLREAGQVEDNSAKSELLSVLAENDSRLTNMWQHYIINHTYENSVSLARFFSEFTAIFGYFYVVVNKYKLLIDAEVSENTNLIYEDKEIKSATDRDGRIRRSERTIRATSEYYLSQVAWAKICINSMQTMLRLAGDEAKMTGGANV